MITSYPRRPDERIFKLMVEQVSDYVIYMTDPTGQVMTWNKGGFMLYRYQPDEILGRNYACFFTEEDQNRLLPERYLQKAYRDGQTMIRCVNICADGNEIMAEKAIHPLYNYADRFIGFSIITHVPDLKRR